MQIPDTVKSAIPRRSVISAPVIRSRLSIAQLHPRLIGATRHMLRRRGTIHQPELALRTVAADPLAGRALADAAGRAARVRDQPSFNTRRHNNTLPFGLSLALRAASSGALLRD